VPPSRVLPVLAAVVTVVLWASAFIGVRAVGGELDPGPLALGRMLVGTVVLTLVVAVRAARRRRPPVLPRGRFLLGVLAWGVAWFGLYNLALNTAETRIDAGTTALLVNLAPVIVGVLAGLLLGEGFPRRLMIGLAVAFAGVALIALTTSTGRGDLLGVLLGLAAAVLYAGAATAQKRLLVRIDALTLTWLGAAAGTVVCLPFAPRLVEQVAAAPGETLPVVLYLGVFPTAIAFLLWGWALSRTSAGRMAASTYAVPPLVVLLSWAVLAEVPAPLTFVGGAICLLGVAIATGVLGARLRRTEGTSRRQAERVSRG